MSGTKNEIIIVVKLALPLIAAFMAQKGMQLIDTFMMGRLGPEALAAGALGTSLFMSCLVFCMGVLSATGVFVSRALGANQDDDVNKSLQHGMLLALLLSLPCMFILWYVDYLLIWVGQNAMVVENMRLFLHGILWGIPGFLGFLVLREFVSAFSFTRIVMIICVCALPLTFVANYVLIYGVWGFPLLGIAGIGFAGAVIQWLMFFGLLIYVMFHPILKKHVKSQRVSWRKLQAMISVGVPSGIILLLEVGMCSMAVIMLGYFGVDVLAAHQIAMQCVTIAFAFPFALSMATALRVSKAMGEKDYRQACRSTYVGLLLGLVMAIFVTFLFVFFPNLLIKSVLNNLDNAFPVINKYAIIFLSIAALVQCFDAIQTIANGALRGFKDTFVPMLLSVVCYWLVGVMGGYLLAFHLQLGAAGIWYGLMLGVMSACVALSLRFFHRVKQEKLALNC